MVTVPRATSLLVEGADELSTPEMLDPLLRAVTIPRPALSVLVGVASSPPDDLDVPEWGRPFCESWLLEEQA